MAKACPRCLGRMNERHGMFPSPLPYRVLTGSAPDRPQERLGQER
jgi:hypothetical protein